MVVFYGTQEIGEKITMKTKMNNLADIAYYMESQGLRFSSNKSTNEQYQYAILGGKTSVGYREQAKDGVNGIILYCAKDKEDCNRFVSLMHKEVYSNSDNVRPYKIQIAENELDKAIEILKMNPLNV